MGVTQPRVSWAALWDYANGRGIATVADLATVCGVDRRVLQRYKAAGTLTDTAADRIAVRLGEVPDAIWGEEWAEATAELVRRADAEEATERAAAEARAAASRAMRAATKRRYRAQNPDYAARQRAARKAAYEHGRAYETARQRRYYEENTEQERARVRAFHERNRERELERARERYRRSVRGKMGKTSSEEFFSTNPTPATTSTSPIHAQSTLNPHAHGAGRVASLGDNGTTEQEVA